MSNFPSTSEGVTNSREGTRGRKISMQHMLGEWSGPIDGCNCPGCKDNKLTMKSDSSAAKLITSPKNMRIQIVNQRKVGEEQKDSVMSVVGGLPETLKVDFADVLSEGMQGEAKSSTVSSISVCSNEVVVDGLDDLQIAKTVTVTNKATSYIEVSNAGTVGNGHANTVQVLVPQIVQGAKRPIENIDVVYPLKIQKLSKWKEKEDPMVLSQLSPVDESNVEVTNTDFIEVFDKALGDISTMFKRVNDDPLNYVECTVCFKKMKESSMKQHFRTHVGLRPHLCDLCGTRFTRKGDVYRHKRVVHKKLKPYICRKCNRTFPDRGLLILHLQNHDKHVYYECETCHYKFGKKEYYESHIRYIHPLPEGAKVKEIIGAFDKAQAQVVAQLKELEEEDQLIGVPEQSRYYTKKSTKKTLSYSLDDDNEDDLDDDDEEMIDDLDEFEDDALIHGDGTGSDHCSNSNSSCSSKPGDADAITVTSAPALPPPVPSVELQTVSQTDTRDEDLVNKLLDAAVSQATQVLDSVSSNHRKKKPVPVDDKLLHKVKPLDFAVNASMDGVMRRFIIQILADKEFDLQSVAGMQLIVNMVNQLCEGKGNFDSTIEVEFLNGNSKESYCNPQSQPHCSPNLSSID